MAEPFDEPFDELMGPPAEQMRANLSQPPVATERKSTSAPPLDAFKASPRASPGASQAPPSNAFTHDMADRWNQSETADPDTYAAEAALASARAIAAAAEQAAARQFTSTERTSAYEFRRSQSDVNGSSSLRKHSWRDDPDKLDDAHVRDEAMKVLNVVDSRLKNQYRVERTANGSFRHGDESPVDEPYMVHRTESGTLESGVGERSKKRVPSALAGLNFSGRPQSDRLSWRDNNFRNDNVLSCDGEDEILYQGDGNSVVEEKKTGDFEDSKSKSWSSRYAVDNTLLAMAGGLSGEAVLNNMERQNLERERMSARNMIASSAYSVKTKFAERGTSISEQRGNVFGSGFSFRQKHVFGKQEKASAWKDVDIRDGSSLPPSTSVHYTWQQALLNKKRRRRTLLVATLLCIGVVIVAITTFATNKYPSRSTAAGQTANGSSPGLRFYVTSNVPFDHTEEDKLVKDLRVIPGDADFVVHLGNIQNAALSLCPSSRYSDVASILKKSPVPLLAVPGQEDWIRCPKPDVSLQLWRESLGNIDDSFTHNFQIFRQNEHMENFAMLYEGVLFFGLNLVSGQVEDQDDWDGMQEAMLAFFFGMFNINKDQFRAVVIFGNARPGPQQEYFFQNVMEGLEKVGVPVAYIHANPGSGNVEEYTPFQDHDTILGIQTQVGGKNPPLRVTVGFGNRPFLLG
jgi:hypothetical protein